MSLGCCVICFHRARQRLRAEQGLVGMENVILAHCALKPGVVEGAACEKANDNCAIRASEKYLKVACTEVLITLPLSLLGTWMGTVSANATFEVTMI